MHGDEFVNVPRPNIVWRGAHPANFTVGRPGASRDGRNTFHHVVGSAESAVLVFNNGSRGASAHLVITDRTDVAAWQCVDFNNTAWSDGNWESNLRTISMEHHGDWRNGYRNEQVIENSARVVAWLRDQGLVNRAIRHREVYGTQCPSDLVVEEIWNRATDIIRKANEPIQPALPEWRRNRVIITPKTVYSQTNGIFIRNLNAPDNPADTRRFALNQSFLVSGSTRVDGRDFYITKSSMDTNAANGLSKAEVADTPYVSPPPELVVPKPTTPSWADSLLVDEVNREMYVLRATPIIDLENGRPYVDPKTGKEVWLQAGDIVSDISAHTIVEEVTYQVTEYSFKAIKSGKLALANGIKSSDLTTDPRACPPGTPANPTPAPEPSDPIEPMPDVPNKDDEQDARLNALEKLVKLIADFLEKFFKDFKR